MKKMHQYAIHQHNCNFYPQDRVIQQAFIAIHFLSHEMGMYDFIIEQIEYSAYWITK